MNRRERLLGQAVGNSARLGYLASSIASMARCDEPGCLSRATDPHLVGLGGMVAYYCADHAPSSNQETREGE